MTLAEFKEGLSGESDTVLLEYLSLAQEELENRYGHIFRPYEFVNAIQDINDAVVTIKTHLKEME